MRTLLIYCLCLVLIVCAAAPDRSFALDDDSPPFKEAKARFGADSASGTLANLHYSPLKLSDGSTLTVITAEEMAPLADQLTATLHIMHTYLTHIFGEIPKFETSIRIMDENTFEATTGAPRWTNALFFRGQIIIPLSKNFSSERDFENLRRSVKHEYTHAVVHALSGGRCPGWLDEGLAQWAEGHENTALPPALDSWLRSNAPIRLSLLQGGFTKLDSAMVPAAYAQSLFAANTVMETTPFEDIRAYFDALRTGLDKEAAFKRYFRISEDAFEAQLEDALRSWLRERKKRDL